MWNYPTLDFDKYLLDLTKGDNILYNTVRKELEYKYINFIVSNSAPKEGRICLFTYLMNKYEPEHFCAKLDYEWHISISFKLAIIFLKDPKQILGIEMEQLTSTVLTDMLYQLKDFLHGTLKRFVNDIKSKKEQEQLQLAWEKDKEQVELEREKKREQLELEQKKEQEQLKLQQEQLKKEKEDNEKKLKQSKIDTIVSYFFNRNLN